MPMNNNDSPFINPNWLEMQQQYLQALSSFYPDSGKNNPGTGNRQVWNEALDYWLDSVKGHVPAENRPVFESIIGQSRVFYAMTDQFAAMLKAISSAGDTAGDWQAIMTEHFGRMKSMLDSGIQAGADPTTAPPFMWSFPAESWQQLMKSMSVVPDGMFARLAEEGIESSTEKLLAIPGLGMTRELQDKLQRALQAWTEYQHQSRHYNAVFTRLGKEALDRLQQDIMKKADSGEKISSLKQIYNMWIDANEDVFAEFAFTDEYARLYGDLVNALTAFRRQSNELSDDLLALVNVPTSAGVNTVTRRQHQMRNELRSSRELQRQTVAELDEVRAELQKLQADLRAVKKQGAKVRQPAAKTRTTNKKKSTGARKTGKGKST